MTTLNCKPGDLARIISTAETRLYGCVDRIITVTVLEPMLGVLPGWRYQGPLMRCACGCGRSIELIGDAVLRPLRGGEGDDETLAWAGLPAVHDEGVSA